MAKLLIVEDDPELQQALRKGLSAENHLVDVAGSGEEARFLLRTGIYDLVILDWNLPDGTGINVAKDYRASNGSAPVLILTARRDSTEKIEGLDAGADDYMTKPFSLPELRARIRALLRRSPVIKDTNSATVRDITLDTRTCRVTHGGQEVKLRPREFALLSFLMRNPDTVFSAESLIERVWGTYSETSPDNIRTYINRLRQKLSDDDASPIIETIHGVGYRLNP